LRAFKAPVSFFIVVAPYPTRRIPTEQVALAAVGVTTPPEDGWRLILAG
jgi:hypothetical protein